MDVYLILCMISGGLGPDNKNENIKDFVVSFDHLKKFSK